MRKLGRASAIASAVLLTSHMTPLSGACEDAVCFVLREYNGKIALFSESSDEPLAVYETPLSSLYPADVELLKNGIRLKNRAEVTRLIADLGIDN